MARAVDSDPESNAAANDEVAARGGVRGVLARPRARMILLAVAVLIVIGGVIAWRYFAIRETTDDAQIDGHITPISARVGGTVMSVRVDDNEFVKAGAVLVEIDPRDYHVALQRAEAEFADAQANLQAAQVGVPITTTTTTGQVSTAGANVERAQAGLQAATGNVDAAKARLVTAQARQREAVANATRAARDLERMKQLIAKEEISQQQYDAAVAAADQSRAAVEAAQSAVVEAQQGVQVAESQRVQATGALTEAEADLRTARTGPQQVQASQARAAGAQARVQQAQAVLEQARLNLQYTSIVAPTDGIVSKKSVEVGQVVQPGQALLAVVPLEDIWVTANFKETQLRDMRVGQVAQVSVDAYGHTYHARVQSIAAATGARFSLLPPENATGNYVKVVQRVPVKITFDKGQDPNHLLRPGMSVVVTVFTK
ncbi:MAG: HlyD family efflux transporter periplasmic adaptor subunit [Bacteroidales bacterium]